MHTEKFDVSIDALYNELETWRNNKTRRSEKMPDHLWQKIIKLHEEFPSQASIYRRLGITKTQLKNKLREFGHKSVYDDPVELCKIPTISPNNPSIVSDDFSPLATTVAELCRPDGYILKIHITTKSIAEIINGFLGGHNVTDNCKA